MADIRRTFSYEEIRERLIPLFSEEGLQLILLFGSAGAGRMHQKSDIDLGFLFDRPMPVLSITNRVLRLLHTDRVDVVDLRHASPLLKYASVEKGRPIYERSPGVFHAFSSLAFRMYVDTKKLRHARALGIKRFLEARGLS